MPLRFLLAQTCSPRAVSHQLICPFAHPFIHLICLLDRRQIFLEPIPSNSCSPGFPNRPCELSLPSHWLLFNPQGSLVSLLFTLHYPLPSSSPLALLHLLNSPSIPFPSSSVSSHFPLHPLFYPSIPHLTVYLGGNCSLTTHSLFSIFQLPSKTIVNSDISL